jgi:hypothetical protein
MHAMKRASPPKSGSRLRVFAFAGLTVATVLVLLKSYFRPSSYLFSAPESKDTVFTPPLASGLLSLGMSVFFIFLVVVALHALRKPRPRAEETEFPAWERVTLLGIFGLLLGTTLSVFLFARACHEFALFHTREDAAIRFLGHNLPGATLPLLAAMACGICGWAGGVLLRGTSGLGRRARVHEASVRLFLASILFFVIVCAVEVLLASLFSLLCTATFGPQLTTGFQPEVSWEGFMMHWKGWAYAMTLPPLAVTLAGAAQKIAGEKGYVRTDLVSPTAPVRAGFLLLLLGFLVSARFLLLALMDMSASRGIATMESLVLLYAKVFYLLGFGMAAGGLGLVGHVVLRLLYSRRARSAVPESPRKAIPLPASVAVIFYVLCVALPCFGWFHSAKFSHLGSERICVCGPRARTGSPVFLKKSSSVVALQYWQKRVWYGRGSMGCRPSSLGDIFAQILAHRQTGMQEEVLFAADGEEDLTLPLDLLRRLNSKGVDFSFGFITRTWGGLDGIWDRRPLTELDTKNNSGLPHVVIRKSVIGCPYNVYTGNPRTAPVNKVRILRRPEQVADFIESLSASQAQSVKAIIVPRDGATVSDIAQLWDCLNLHRIPWQTLIEDP